MSRGLIPRTVAFMLATGLSVQFEQHNATYSLIKQEGSLSIGMKTICVIVSVKPP